MKLFRSTLLLIVLFLSPLCIGSVPLGTPDLDDIEYPEDEPPSEAEVNLGKLLFFDARLSGNGKMSCASCHNPDYGFGDGLALSLGSEGNKLSRHTPHLYNLAWSSIMFWDGRASSLEQQVLMPISNPEEMNLPPEKMLDRIVAIALYKEQFREVYGQEDVDTSLVSRALASFMRSLISVNAPFDRYMSGDTNAMSPEAVRGMKLFEGKANCIECHDGPNFTNDSFHSLGIAIQDKGRGGLFNDPSMAYRFKTPGLRNTALTAPFMHNGSLADLEAVVKFYNQGGGEGPNKDKLMVPLELTEAEIRDLLAFLAALTDPVVVERPVLTAKQ